MKPKELDRLAKSLDVMVPPSSTAPDIIRMIQVAEGHNPCYQSEISPVCGIEDCLWRDKGCVSGEMPQ